MPPPQHQIQQTSTVHDTKGRRDYQRQRFVIVSLTRTFLTLERDRQEELANDRH